MSENRKEWLYSGAGNTFVLVDARKTHGKDWPAEARESCERRKVDGLLVMENTPKADIRMRIFNPDGSEAEMCGNGSRCAAHWAHHDAGFKSPMTIETGAGVLKAEVKGGDAKVRLTDPRDLRNGLELKLDGKTLKAYHINTGVPHTVIPVDDVAAVPVEKWGRLVRNDAMFKPRGTNVCFLQVKSGGNVEVRTYERGVEGETQACGTGAAASALVASRAYSFQSPVSVRTASGDTLKIHFKPQGGAFTDVYLEGPVKRITS